MVSNTVLGTSFSPEYCKSIGVDNPIEILKIVYQKLNIKDIRLGLRWNVIEKDSNLSLKYYDKYLQYLFKNKGKICLNIGPIKVFRWPEQHIPIKYTKYSVNNVTKDCELALYSYEYFSSLLVFLKKEYGDRLNDVIFQFENEPFYNFGKLNMIMSDGYMVEIAKILKKFFPENRVMINSAGKKNLKKILNLFNTLEEEKIYEQKNLILGFNYYFRLPNKLKSDPLNTFNPLELSMNKLHKIQKEKKFGLEISEAQFEPWGRQNSPGNSYDEYIYTLNKCERYFPKGYEYKLVRLWGIERFVSNVLNNTMSQEHIKIRQSILS